ncbi:N-acetylmuramoyl-L-alanine amidase [Marinilabilia salmonicolor]|uniref:N-acetylmuramoyl-L-alanine amidase n=1 Tax=Marinilabilia salmonicolor TaxID=989 RepID=UPI00029AFB3A|nr:N-acetylmuramoyl-L-alanine amidase [Marinilabilia salmonicolor]
MKVIIDNGHGVDTHGKRSPKWADGSQLFEWEFNRDIAKRLAKALKSKGVESVLIVPEQTDVELSERVRRVNEIYRRNPGSFLVSIHANAGGGTGWEVFTSVGETRSDDIAECFVKSAEKLLPWMNIRKDMTDGDGDKEAQFYVLKHTHCPAVLTENLFMDTVEDCRFIMSEKGRQVITDLHVEAILMAINKGYA